MLVRMIVLDEWIISLTFNAIVKKIALLFIKKNNNYWNTSLGNRYHTTRILALEKQYVELLHCEKSSLYYYIGGKRKTRYAFLFFNQNGIESDMKNITFDYTGK